MFGPHDGTRVQVHPYRRMMGFLMRGRNESAVYFEQQLDVSRTLPWLAQYIATKPASRATIFHVVLHAIASVLHERERLNRFTVGRKTYQRKRVYLSFAALKSKPVREATTSDHGAALATIKRAFDKGETFDALVTALGGEVGSARSDRPSAMDKEMKTLLAFPGPLLAFGIGLLKRLYAIGLAPKGLVDTDPLYTSAFVANLGSLDMDAAYHHLYEHGNCPLFAVIGRIVDRAVVIDGQIVVRPILTIRYSFDERVEDGFYAGKALKLLASRIEDPASWIGHVEKTA